MFYDQQTNTWAAEEAEMCIEQCVTVTVNAKVADMCLDQWVWRVPRQGAIWGRSAVPVTVK